MQGVNIASVQFHRAGKIFDFSYGEIALNIGDSVVVETERGMSLATVVRLDYAFDFKNEDKKLRPILRKASSKEVLPPPTPLPEDVVKFTEEKVTKFKLKMRVLKSEVQFGGNKVIIYFSAPGRVDFRELVKELAGGLKARVELKQVGARDETKLLGGMGICGREYCCSSFLREFVPVSIRMAKNQNLALNPTKISGGCGRLLCCLTYENDVYTELRQVLPPRGTRVRIIASGEEAVVMKADLLNQTVMVETPNAKQYVLALKEVAISSSAKIRTEGESITPVDSWGDDIDLNVLVDYL